MEKRYLYVTYALKVGEEPVLRSRRGTYIKTSKTTRPEVARVMTDMLRAHSLILKAQTVHIVEMKESAYSNGNHLLDNEPDEVVAEPQPAARHHFRESITIDGTNIFVSDFGPPGVNEPPNVLVGTERGPVYQTLIGLNLEQLKGLSKLINLAISNIRP